MSGHDAWAPVVDLIERVVCDEDLLPSTVAAVRTMVREIGTLHPSDIAGHTRVLLTAATRAVAARRGPTEAELSFVEELGVTRARQGVSVEAVLAAIHVAERQIWSRARELAAAAGVGPDRLLDARELYDDWAQAVRTRLIKAHRAAEADQKPRPGDRDAAIVRRLLEGGSAAALAAAEAGLPVSGGLWVLAARADGAGAAELADALPACGRAVSALLEGMQFAVLGWSPVARPVGLEVAVGAAGPAEPEELPALRHLAVAALAAAESTGRRGVVHIAHVPVLAAIADRADLTRALLDRHRGAQAALGANAEPVALAVRAWLEADRDVNAAAGRLFVHPNTVRNRVQRFAEVTGIDPYGTFGAVDAWWLCRAWLDGER